MEKLWKTFGKPAELLLKTTFKKITRKSNLQAKTLKNEGPFKISAKPCIWKDVQYFLLVKSLFNL